MKRFIDLNDQILEGTKEFAWYDTVVDKFETHSYSQTWACWDDFEGDYIGKVEDLLRYKSLCPDWVF